MDDSNLTICFPDDEDIKEYILQLEDELTILYNVLYYPELWKYDKDKFVKVVEDREKQLMLLKENRKVKNQSLFGYSINRLLEGKSNE